MKRNLFDPESLFWKPFGYIGEIAVLSLLWALCSVPVITVGPASAALYDCTWHCVRNKEDDLFSRFFRTFKAELKDGIISWVIWAIILGALAYLGSISSVPVIFAVLVILPLGILSWLFPTQSRFTFHLRSLNSTAVKLSFGNIVHTVIMGIVLLPCIWLCARFVLPLILIPGLFSLLSSFLIEPVFSQYINRSDS